MGLSAADCRQIGGNTTVQRDSRLYLRELRAAPRMTRIGAVNAAQARRWHVAVLHAFAAGAHSPDDPDFQEGRRSRHACGSTPMTDSRSCYASRNADPREQVTRGTGAVFADLGPRRRRAAAKLRPACPLNQYQSGASLPGRGRQSAGETTRPKVSALRHYSKTSPQLFSLSLAEDGRSCDNPHSASANESPLTRSRAMPAVLGYHAPRFGPASHGGI